MRAPHEVGERYGATQAGTTGRASALESDHVHSARPVVGVPFAWAVARAAKVLVGAHAHVVAPPRELLPERHERLHVTPRPRGQERKVQARHLRRDQLHAPPGGALVMPMFVFYLRRETKVKVYKRTIAEAGDLHNLCI